MAILTTAQQFHNQHYKEAHFGVLISISVGFHVFMLVVVPILTTLILRSPKFERPKTFQLVSIPSQAQRKITVNQNSERQRVAKRELKEEPKPVPSKTPAPARAEKKPSPSKEAARSEENVDELESLLDELPSPVQIASAGTGRLDPYFALVQSKVERNWTPPSENRKLSVGVAFSIHRDGTATDVRLAKSSGNSTLDNLALRAVTMASPFPRIPPNKPDKLDIELTLFPYRN